MNTLISHLKTVGLQDNDIELWSRLLHTVSLDRQKELEEILTSHHEFIPILTKNLRDKIAIFSNGDNVAWDNLVKEEEKDLKNNV